MTAPPTRRRRSPSAPARRWCATPSRRVPPLPAVCRRGPRGYIRERRRLRYMPARVREVPELRGSFVAGLFLSQRSAKFDLALAGLATAALTRRAWPLAAAVPYARTLRRGQL